MNKEELIRELSAKIYSGEISQEEIFNRLNLPSTITPTVFKETEKATHFTVTKVLYVLGAAIIIIGIIIFIGQIWGDISSIGRIVITLGLGLLLAAIGSALLKQKPKENIGAVFHFIGGILIPGGTLVTLYELGADFVSLWPVVIAFGSIFLFYLLLHTVHKHSILTFFTITNGTAFVYLLVEAIVKGSYYAHADLYAYLTMVIGISYLLLAHAFKNTWNKHLVGLLNFFGSAGFLGAAFSQIFDSALWQLAYFLLVLGGLFLSVYFKSRSILALSTIFLLAHVSFITSEYFADSLGWPITLVILGFVFIGLAYFSVTINKKYIKNSA